MSWTIDKARGWVDDARHFYIINGKRTALTEFTRSPGLFAENEMYIFVLNSQGTMLAHGVNEKFVGQDFLNIRDVDGKEFIREIIEKANTLGYGWVEYKWYHPKTKKVLPKVVYFEKVDDLIICSGSYLETRKDNMLQAGTVMEVRPQSACHA